MIVNTPTASEIIRYVARKSGKDEKDIRECYLRESSLLTFLKATLDVKRPSRKDTSSSPSPSPSSSSSPEVSYKVRAISQNLGILFGDEDVFTARDSSITYLDHGCGDGTITAELATLFNATSTFGVDVYEHPALNAAVTLRMPDKETGDLPFADETFDVITCILSLHHVPKAQQMKTVAELSRILKVGGHLLIYEHDVAATTSDGKTMTRKTRTDVSFNLRMYLDAVHMTFMFYGDKNEMAEGDGGKDPRLITPGDVLWIFESTYHPREWYQRAFEENGLMKEGYYHEKNRQMMYYETFTKTASPTISPTDREDREDREDI